MPLQARWARTDSLIFKSLCNMPKYSYRDTPQWKITCGFSSLNVCCFPVFGITDLKPIPFGQYWLRSFGRKWLQTKAVTIENTSTVQQKMEYGKLCCVSHSISSGGFKILWKWLLTPSKLIWSFLNCSALQLWLWNVKQMLFWDKKFKRNYWCGEWAEKKDKKRRSLQTSFCVKPDELVGL